MIRSLLALALTLAAWGATQQAVAATVRTSVSIGYETGFFSKKPNDETYKKADPLMREAVWKKYLTRLSPEARELLLQKEGDIMAKLSEVISSLNVTDTEIDEKSKTMYFEVEAVIDDNLLNVLLKGSATPSGQGSLTAFLVLPRLQAEVKSYDAKVVKKATASTSMASEKVGAEDIQESDTGVTEREVEGEKLTMSTKAKTSGSTTRKAQKVKWKLGNARDVDAAVNRYLSNAGFEAVTYGDFAGECGAPSTEEVRSDLLASPAAELSDDIRRAAFKSAKGCEFKYFVMGTLDIDSIAKDPNSDNVLARANVSLKVYDVSSRFPKAVVSIGPVAYTGAGAQEDGATTDALLKSAKEATQNIVQQLRLKGLQ